MRWISVEEDLPPADTEVLVVYLPSFATEFSIISAKFNPRKGWNISAEVHYWGALPQLPAIPQISAESPTVSE